MGEYALLTMAEVAERLRKTEKQLHHMIQGGTAPKSAKIGGRRMFRAQDVDDFVAAAFETVGSES